MIISIFGLGYVGTASAACFAQQGHQIIGVDVNPIKIEIINAGRSPVIEREIHEIVSKTVKTGFLRATDNANEAVMESELSMICVGTPSKDNGSLDLTQVERVCQDIGNALSEKKGFHTIALRSTVLPGTIKELVIPVLEKSSGRIAGQDFGVCHNPEFLREGTSVYDFFHPPFTVIGELDSQAAKVTASLYQNLDAPLKIVPLESAEMIKYACNAFHALKVSFANEVGNICKMQGIDSLQVMDIFCMDDKLNLSPYYLRPGFAFGGSCLPKDLRALLYHSHHLDLNLPVLEAILPSNDLQVKHGLELVKQTGYKRVGVLGFSFKYGTDDLRESPLVELIETLLGKGYQVKIYDKNVSLARLHGANRVYIEKEIPHISTLMCDSLEEVLDASDAIVIGNKDPEFVQVTQLLRQNQIVIDLVKINGELGSLDPQYEGICW